MIFFETDCGINGLYREDSSGTRQYYLYNGHGDVVQLGNSSGAVTKTYVYDAFGNEKNIDSNDTNPMRYCGEYYDKETGTIYLRARYYDASIGRFISEDSVRGKANDPLSLNLHTYCVNNPVMLVDPSGNTTIAIGGSVNLSFAARVEGTAQVVFDFEGNIGIMVTIGGGLGTPATGGNLCIGITSAKSIDELNGLGQETGVSANTVGIGIAGISVGVDFTAGDTYAGMNINIGAELKPELEGHCQVTYSAVKNVTGDEAKELKQQIISNIKSLPDEVKKTLYEKAGVSNEDELIGKIGNKN